MFSFSRIKVTIALILVALLISAALIFFIFRNSGVPAAISTAPSNNSYSAPAARTNLPNAVIFSPSAPSAGSAEAISGETPVPKTQSRDDLFSSFLKRTKSAAEQVQPTNAAPAAPLDFNTQKSTVTAEGIILNLEPDEFAFIYPRSFLDSLQNTAQAFIKSIDAGYLTLPAVKTDADVRMIEEKLIDALYQSGIYTSERAATARKTIRFTLPRLQLMDLQVRAQKISLQEHIKNQNSIEKLVFFTAHAPQFLGFFYADNSSPKIEPASSRDLFFGDIINQLKSAISPSAQAACGSCADSPECYQVGAATPDVQGSETFRVACQCSGCLSGLGCLDGCGSGVAAIYDPQTRICGCGI